MEKQGMRPFQQLFDEIKQMEFSETKQRTLLFAQLAKRHGIDLLFSFSIQPDAKNPGNYAIYISQPSLSLGEPEFFNNEKYTGICLSGGPKIINNDFF